MKRKRASNTWTRGVARRLFMKKLGIAAATGATLGYALQVAAQAQQPRRVQRRVTARGRASSVQRFKQAFEGIQGTRTVGQRANRRWSEHLQGMSGSDRIAAVATIEISQRHPNCKDIAHRIAAVTREASSDWSRSRGGSRGPSVAQPEPAVDLSQLVLQATGGLWWRM